MPPTVPSIASTAMRPGSRRRGATSTVATDIQWPGAVDALVGQSIRVNQSFFPVTGNGTGANCRFTVSNLTLPDLAPAPGPCSLTISPEHQRLA